MSEPEFQRFSGVARVVHWLIAVPYLALLVSGAILLLHHLGWVNAVSANLPATLHRWVGVAFAAIVLNLLLATLLGGQWRSIGRDLRAWLSLGPRELLWLICVPLNSFLPGRFRLPPAGRFNAGQKLHGLFIVIAITGFIATGLIMILRPGSLNAWLVHTWLFFGAAAFLGLHLFLALINPATRRARGGIFTGRVSQDYIKEHHALVLDEIPAACDHHAAVSIKAMILAGLPVAVALFIWWHGHGRSLVRATIASPQENAMISPGALISAHSQQLHGDHCAACHTHSGPATRGDCLACHVEVQSALDQSAGYHGKLSGECAACHIEHRGANADLRSFDAHAFNHQLARFPLNGAHGSLACDQCHVQHSPTSGSRRYIGVKFAACSDCHANPHVDMPSAACARCHGEQNWKGRGLLFNHNRDSRFKLDAIHSTLSCGSCHKEVGSTPLFRGLPTTCEQCHASIASAMAGKIGTLIMKPDPHEGRVSCIECHTLAIRSPTSAQFAAQCERCHGLPYRTLFFNWQKALDEREQSARLRLRQQAGANPQPLQLGAHLIDQAHEAGLHNVQQAIEAFEKIGR